MTIFYFCGGTSWHELEDEPSCCIRHRKSGGLYVRKVARTAADVSLRVGAYKEKTLVKASDVSLGRTFLLTFEREEGPYSRASSVRPKRHDAL